MRAREIERLLATRHSKDVFVSQCKSGPTWGGGPTLQLDAWAMKRSWTNSITYGYEIKVDRSDFLRDEKWHAYLDFCSEFSFVCPHGVIDPEEVPKQAGLLYVTKTGTRIWTKKKAPRRAVDVPLSLLMYVVMTRSEITPSQYVNGPPGHGDREYWEQWLEKREINEAFGRRVGRAIREEVEKQILGARRENAALERRMEGYDEVRRLIERLGLDPDADSTWAARRKIQELFDGEARSDVDHTIDRAIGALESLKNQMNQIREEAVA